MTKLTDKRIEYACRQAAKGRGGLPHETPGQMAARWGVTPRRIRQLQQQHRETGVVPTLNPNRRPKGPPLTKDEQEAIEQVYHETRRGARKLHVELHRRGIKIPRHKVHDHMKRQGWSKPNPRKQKRRSRCRYEREHSGSLVHGDWHRTSEDHPYVILWLDDASRRILGGMESDRISAENSIASFRAALAEAARWNVQISDINTDRGAEFHANEQKGKNPGVSQFRLFLDVQGIRHVLSRTNNPQTNGKLERLWLEYDRHRWRFPDLAAFIAWHNDQVHDALWVQVFETPDEAFQRKLPQESMLGLHFQAIDQLVQEATL